MNCPSSVPRELSWKCFIRGLQAVGQRWQVVRGKTLCRAHRNDVLVSARARRRAISRGFYWSQASSRVINISRLPVRWMSFDARTYLFTHTHKHVHCQVIKCILSPQGFVSKSPNIATCRLKRKRSSGSHGLGCINSLSN